MEKITVISIVLAVLLIAGAVFAAADFLDEEPVADGGGAEQPKACSDGQDCSAGCGGTCGGSCGVSTCGCRR